MSIVVYGNMSLRRRYVIRLRILQMIRRRFVVNIRQSYLLCRRAMSRSIILYCLLPTLS